MAADPGNSDGSGMITGINITPFVDIALVLLIIFMVTAKLMVAPSSVLPIKLPKASTATDIQEILAITLTQEGGTLVNGQAADTDETFLAAANSEHGHYPTAKVVIQADGEVPHRRVIHAMDLLAKAHFTEIAFAVRVEKKASKP